MAELTEVASWGSADGPETALTTVIGALVIGEGDLAVFQWGTPSVWIFDATGRRIRALGGRGAGPGEFSQPVFGGVLADSLWIADLRLSRIVVFDERFRPVRTVSSSITLADGRMAHPRALTAPGTVLRVPASAAVRLGAIAAHASPIVRSSGDLTAVDTVAMVRTHRELLRLELGGRSISIQNPANWSSKTAISSDGALIAVVDQVHQGSQAAFTLRLISSVSGDTIATYAATQEAVPLDRRVVTEWAELFSDEAVGLSGLATRRERQTAYEAALSEIEAMPPVRNVMFGADNTVWLESQTARLDRREGSLWYVWTPTLARVGTVELRYGERLLASRIGYVWTTAEGDLDIPLIRRYRVDWKP